MIKFILIVLSAALLVPNFIDKNINDNFAYDHKERFDPTLSYINTIEKLERHTDSLASLQNIPQRSAEYFMLLEEVVSKRFYHGFSQFSLRENWLAATGESLFGNGLACKVEPEKIITQPEAACSQQVIVMMAIARLKNIDYRSVGFPHHYALELKTGGIWYFYDPNLEPVMNKEQRSALHWQTMTGSLKRYYRSTIQSGFGYMFGSVSPTLGKINADPAPNATLFQRFTMWMSKILWLVPLLILALRSYKLRVAGWRVTGLLYFLEFTILRPLHYLTREKE